MLAEVPTVQRSLLEVKNAGAIALGGGEVIWVLLLLSLVTVEVVVLSVIIVSPDAPNGTRSINNSIILIMLYFFLSAIFSTLVLMALMFSSMRARLMF